MDEKLRLEILEVLTSAAVDVISSGEEHRPILIVNPQGTGRTGIIALDVGFGSLGKHAFAAIVRGLLRREGIECVAFVDEAWAARFPKDTTREKMQAALQKADGVKGLEGAFEVLVIQLETQDDVWAWNYKIVRDDAGVRLVDTSEDAIGTGGDVEANLRFLSNPPPGTTNEPRNAS